MNLDRKAHFSYPIRVLWRWNIAAISILATSVFGLTTSTSAQSDAPKRIVVLGDSLTAGYQLPAADGFTSVLQANLRAKGISVEVVNASVSGDTASAGLERFDWSLGSGADAVIVELGANDMLRGIDVQVTYGALDRIISKLKERKIPVLLAGMKASRSVGSEYRDAFDALYTRLAEKHEVLLYPFFLQGVAGQSEFNLQDGIHPNSAGVRRIVENITPYVLRLLAASAP